MFSLVFLVFVWGGEELEAAGAGCKVSGTDLWRGMCLEAGQEQRLLGGAMSRVRLCSVSMGT